jgi:transcriptional regulator with GAF, ATPase, and Fis domain
MIKEQRQLSAGLVVGNRYQVERHLGTSNMGSAYFCTDLMGGGTGVVLRILSFGSSIAEQAKASSREFSLLRRLNHPNLVRIADFGVVANSGDLFLVRDWIQGQNLYTATEGTDADAILNIAMDLSRALQYLHTRGIVHGHLSPFNAILSNEEKGIGKLRLVDFGLSRRIGNEQLDRSIGMLAYTAPEILSGGQINKSSDLYSLGILMYQLLTRRLPFEDADPEFLIQKHLQSSVDLRPIERMRGGSRVSPLVQSLLDKNPDKRPASGEDVIRLIIDASGRNWLNADIKELESHFCASQFVGRERELLHLQESARRVTENARGWTVFITGEAGSGKTRCMEELKSWALLEGWQIAEGTCGSREAGSYAPYRQILANSDPAEGEALFRFQDAPRAAAPEIFDASSKYAAGQYRDLLTRELIRRMRARPTLLLLHDFHLADEATNAVLDYLSSDIQAHSVLMCVSLRSGDEIKGIMGRVIDSVTRQERGEVLPLDPLEKESVEQLIEGMTGDSSLKATLGEWMFKSIGGNPFFLEEMLKHLVEQKLLRREFGRWRFVESDLNKLEVPESIGAVLLRRFEQLSHPARALANWLALFQGDVSGSLLSSVMAQSPALTADALQELSHRQMTRTETKRAEETVGFVHSLIAEVIQSNLPKKLRQKMHRKIAEALEREMGAEGHVQELAMHFMQGNAGEVAVRYAWNAAAQARAEFAHEKALHCYEYIFKNRNGLTNAQICAAAIEASDTMFALGLPKRSIRLLKIEISRGKTVSAELKARMYMQLALSYQHLGDLKMQETCCKKGLSFFRNRPAGEINMTKAMLWAEMAFAAILQSNSRRGLIFLDKARKSCPFENAAALEGRIESLAASMHRIACNLREARSASEKAASILSHSEESYLACSAYSTLGGVLAGIGRFPLALKKHAQAVSLSDKSRSVVLRSQTLGNLAECLCRMGHTQEAVNTAERAVKSVCDANSPAISYAFNAILAETRLAAGNYRGACEVVERLDRNAKHNQAIYTVGHVLYVAASLNFVLGKFDAALEHIGKLCAMENRETPFYERELAEALRARILFEQGNTSKAMASLYALERDVTAKHWPYQMCVIKLHIGDMLVRQRKLDKAECYVGNAFRLAKAMQAVSLMAYSHFLLGLIYAQLHRLGCGIGCSDAKGDSGPAEPFRARAIEELREACRIAESSYHAETVWRAHAELSRILRPLPPAGNYLEHAKKAYELLCKAEDQVPAEMLPAYCSAFDRSQIKEELARLIELGRDQESSAGVAVAEVHDEDKARILLRVSATVSTIGEPGPLLEAILDQLVQAVKVERAFIFLRDELTGSLQLAKGRNDRQASLTGEKNLDRSILADVLKNGRPIVSANAQGDPRFRDKDRAVSHRAGKLLCAPLKLSDRILGVLYADHSSPAGGLSESTVSLFAAFCNIAAMAIDNALARQQLVQEKTELEKYLHQAREEYAEIIGRCASVELLRDRIGLAAASPVDILITGESGTGKELVARAIHRTGRRKNGKFVAVDCGSLSDNLAEAELFGFRKGAFTGAAENRQGLLEAAHGGILFLDELSNLPFPLQAKFLRVLQEREVRRLGEIIPRKIDIQVIAATNKDLLEEMRNEKFRSDLYYRLKAIEIRVPPLRERSGDILLLIEWFLSKSAEQEKGRSKKFLPEALELLKGYSYPGNIRELRNIVVSSYYSTAKTSLGIDDLPPEVRHGKALSAGPESSAADGIYREIFEGRGDFESLVQAPFLRHQFGSSFVRAIIQRALEDSGGIYLQAFVLLRIPESRYSVTMQFLKRNNCYINFRPFRGNRGKNDATSL